MYIDHYIASKRQQLLVEVSNKNDDANNSPENESKEIKSEEVVNSTVVEEKKEVVASEQLISNREVEFAEKMSAIHSEALAIEGFNSKR